MLPTLWPPIRAAPTPLPKHTSCSLTEGQARREEGEQNLRAFMTLSYVQLSLRGDASLSANHPELKLSALDGKDNSVT